MPTVVHIPDYIVYHQIWICKPLTKFFEEAGNHQTLSYLCDFLIRLVLKFLKESQKILVTLNENYLDLSWKIMETSQIFYVKSVLTHSSPSHVWFLGNHNWISFTVQNRSLSTVILLLGICSGHQVIIMQYCVGKEWNAEEHHLLECYAMYLCFRGMYSLCLQGERVSKAGCK